MPVGALFGFQVAVAEQAGAVVVEVGVGGGAEALVEGCEELPSGSGAPREVDARIEVHAARDRGVVVGQHAERDGEVGQEDVVFEIEAEVAAPIFIFIVFVPSRHFVLVLVFFGYFLAQSGGEDVLAAELHTDGCLAECPCGVGIEVDAIDVCLVEILIGRRIGAPPHVVVERAVPIDLCRHMDAAFVFGLGSDEIAAVLLILRVGPRAIERVGTIVHRAQSCLQRGIEMGGGVAAIPVGVALVEVVVAAAAVAAGIASAQAVDKVAVRQSHMGIGAECAIGAALQVRPHVAFLLGARDDIDGSGKGLTAIHTAGSAFDDFDALDVIDIDGQIDRQVPSVGIADVDAVEQHGELVFGATVHTDVGLDAEAAALAHIHAGSEFQQVVDRVGTGGFDVLTGDDLHQAHGFVGRQRGACGGHFCFLQLEFVGGLLCLCIGCTGNHRQGCRKKYFSHVVWSNKISR